MKSVFRCCYLKTSLDGILDIIMAFSIAYSFVNHTINRTLLCLQALLSYFGQTKSMSARSSSMSCTYAHMLARTLFLFSYKTYARYTSQ